MLAVGRPVSWASEWPSAVSVEVQVADVLKVTNLSGSFPLAVFPPSLAIIEIAS